MERTAALILSVDDDADIRELITLALEGEGYRVITAPDGPSALEAAATARPDLILLDYMMPGMNGVEVCARLQDSPATSHIPVVFLTAVTGEVERSRAFALGAVDYLVKPLEPATLKDAVARHLETAGAFARLAQTGVEVPLSERIDPGAFARFRDSLPGRFALGPEATAFLGAMTPATMYTVAARLGVTSVDLAAALGDALGVGVVNQIPAREVRLGVLPAPFSKSNLVVPVRNALVGDAFVLSNPFDWDLMQTLERAATTDAEPAVLVAAPEVVLAVFETALEQIRRRIEINPVAHSRPVDPLSAEGRAVTEATDDVLATVFNLHAEDLMIDPGTTRSEIRAKVDGDVHDVVAVSGERASMMISRLKALAGMDISEKRRPQRGSLEVGFGKDEFDLVIGTEPTQYGEGLTARIIPVGRPARSLAELGMNDAQEGLAHQIMRVPRGLVLIVGPAGSGKTTTANALLSGVAGASKSVLTIEDPIEYRIPFATQQQVDERSGVTAVALLESAARRSPDAVFLGEIVDAATARAAVEHARCNGLLVATMQAPDIFAAIGRFEEYGVPRAVLAEALAGLIGQRLLRTTCAACRSMESPGPQEQRLLETYFASPQQVVARAKGCPVCTGIGRKGRTGVFDVVPATPVLLSALRSGLPFSELCDAVAGRVGVLGYEALAEKVASGLLPLDDHAAAVFGEYGDAARAAHEAPERSAPDQGHATVLVVDDSDDNREYMVSVLRHLGWEVSSASNGVEALGFLGMGRFDLVLSDLNMPLMGGFDLFERAARGENAPPAILYSASSDERDEIRSLRMGAADYIRLPAGPEVVRLRARKALRRG